MSELNMEEIKERLEEWRTSGKIRAASKPNFAADHRYMLALDELHDHAPSDIAALVARVEELEARPRNMNPGVTSYDISAPQVTGFCPICEAREKRVQELEAEERLQAAKLEKAHAENAKLREVVGELREALDDYCSLRNSECTAIRDRKRAGGEFEGAAFFSGKAGAFREVAVELKAILARAKEVEEK